MVYVLLIVGLLKWVVVDSRGLKREELKYLGLMCERLMEVGIGYASGEDYHLWILGLEDDIMPLMGPDGFVAVFADLNLHIF